MLTNKQKIDKSLKPNYIRLSSGYKFSRSADEIVINKILAIYGRHHRIGEFNDRTVVAGIYNRLVTAIKEIEMCK